MPRRELMSWEGTPNYRWVKMYKGARYRVTCHELNAVAFTKEGSVSLANQWWLRKKAELDGAAGAVRGGDRLPWVETGPGQDNFAPLASLTWQAHVYGAPRPGVAEACAGLRLPLHLFEW